MFKFFQCRTCGKTHLYRADRAKHEMRCGARRFVVVTAIVPERRPQIVGSYK